MNRTKSQKNNPIAVLKTATYTLFSNPIILYPFFVLAFMHLLVIEIIFFASRYPLSIFFKPIILYMFGPQGLEYPHNYFVLATWYRSWFVQAPLYIFFHDFFFGMAVMVLHLINNDKSVRLRSVYNSMVPLYIYLFISAILTVGVMFVFSLGYNLIIQRALLIQSTSGKFFLLKRILLEGAPIFNLLIAVGVRMIFAYVIPSIVIEKKKIFSALIANFKILFRSFFTTFFLILLPALLYIPVVLIRSNSNLFESVLQPEMTGLMIIISMMLSLLINAIQFTAITIYYLLQREK